MSEALKTVDTPEMIAAKERALQFAAENLPPGPMRAMLIPSMRNAILAQADALLDSMMVPDHFWPKVPDFPSTEEGRRERNDFMVYRRDAARANVFAALFLAAELGESPFHVMPSIFFIGGKPAWLTAFLRARLAKIHKITLRYRVDGTGASLRVTAYAKHPTDGEPCEASVTMAEAIADGWTKNPKYKNIPERMLHERAASLWISRYAPEIKSGMADEIEAGERHEPMMLTPIPTPTRAVLPETTVQPPALPDHGERGEDIQGLTNREKVEIMAEEAGMSLAEFLGARNWTRPASELSEADAARFLS